MKRPKSTDLAWAAGFFDGEGYTHCQWISHCRNSKQIKMSIAQKYPGLLFRFKDIVGTGNVRGPYYKNKGKRFWIFEWTVQKEKDVERVFKLLKPYLGPLKIEQYEKAWSSWLFIPVALP